MISGNDKVCCCFRAWKWGLDQTLAKFSEKIFKKKGIVV